MDRCDRVCMMRDCLVELLLNIFGHVKVRKVNACVDDIDLLL